MDKPIPQVSQLVRIIGLDPADCKEAIREWEQHRNECWLLIRQRHEIKKKPLPGMTAEQIRKILDAGASVVSGIAHGIWTENIKPFSFEKIREVGDRELALEKSIAFL